MKIQNREFIASPAEPRCIAVPNSKTRTKSTIYPAPAPLECSGRFSQHLARTHNFLVRPYHLINHLDRGSFSSLSPSTPSPSSSRLQQPHQPFHSNHASPPPSQNPPTYHPQHSSHSTNPLTQTSRNFPPPYKGNAYPFSSRS